VRTMSSQVANIHDAFFKQVLSDQQAAGTFLREHLPSEVTGLLTCDLPERVPGSFVDEELRQHHSDLLFQVRLNTGQNAFAYILLEHKSSPDSAARLQLLRYIVRILVSWYEQNGKRLPLPPVLPLLVHQGPEDWGNSCEFVDLFGAVPEILRPHLPSFRHVLVDLGRVADERLSAQPRLRAHLKALKYARRHDLPEKIDALLAEAPVLEVLDVALILAYIDRGSVAVSPDVIHEVLRRLVPDREEEIMGHLTQPYFAKGLAEGRFEGLAEGRAKGLVEGRAEGEAIALVRLLEKRFGVLPAPLRQRVFSADLGSIEAWFGQAIDGPDLESVFKSL
jgi:predicted transposase YdaD